MKYLFVKIIKKIGAILKVKFISELYKNMFLYLLDKSVGHCDYTKYDFTIKNSTINKKIWVYWAQGLAEAPPVVQHCIETLKRNCPAEYSVQVLDNASMHNYITIPEIIQLRLNDGAITRTHFSDIVRFELLKEHGGIWIDSTVLVNENFKEILTQFQSFITLNHENYNPYTAITEGRWTSFFIGMPKGSALAQFMSDAFISYWQKNNKLVDYVLVDYLIALAYKKIPAVQYMIDGQKDIIGNSRWLMQNIYDKELSREIDMTLDADIYKIYKLTYKVIPPENKNTYYYKYFCP